MRIEIPDFCLVLLIGASGSGKSTLAKKLFKPGETLCSDYFRMLVCGDETGQHATADAFDCLYHVAQKRLDRRKLTVIDATNLNKWARQKALDLARDNNCFCIAIALNIPENECQANNAARVNKQFPRSVIRRQCAEFNQALKAVRKENFRHVHVLSSREEVDTLEIARIPLWTDKSDLTGPFDIIGDIHGCHEELCALLSRLGYAVNAEGHQAVPPPGRQAIFLGDLCDRGPANADVLRLVINMTAQGHGLCVPGNHDDKLSRYLEGKKVQLNHGLEQTVAQLECAGAGFKKEVKDFLRSLVSHYLLDNGRLLVCHAGLPERMHARSSRNVREFCLYGDPSGEVDEYGLPERNDWARDYNGNTLVAYGHCPTSEQGIVNNTICLDGGCVFGGSLVALRYPEMDIVSVPARKEYCHCPRGIRKRLTDSRIDCQKLLARQRLETSLGVPVVREEERSLQALEIMGRFAIDPAWLVYLPPTMSPCETSSLADYLEHPREALAYYKKRNIQKVICEEKHMGSRAIAIVCKNEAAARERFGSPGEHGGLIYTRTGRPFFTANQTELHKELVERFRQALTSTGFWEDHDTDWVCLDCELMPWSFKAQALVDSQYAPYGLSGINGLDKTLTALEKFRSTLGDMSIAPAELTECSELEERLTHSRQNILKYNKVWRSYCKPVEESLNIKIAPFHILATDRKVWSDIGHDRHLELIEKYLGSMPGFTSTRNKIIDLSDPEAVEHACAFWENLLADGAEGMVVKPLKFIARQGDSFLQPAIKCRGREYLRIIYGAGYTDNLEGHKQRSLAGKRKRALREFALGLEALERFAHGEPVHKIHECLFTILALESEPQDARL